MPKKPAPRKPSAKRRAAAPVRLPAGLHRLSLSSTSPVRGETKTLAVDQPCRLFAAVVVMQGAATGISTLGLELDGRIVHLVAADRVVAQALTMPNASGVFATHASYGNTWTVIFGWAQPVAVAQGAKVLIQIGEDVAELDMSLLIEA